jgi:porin
MNSKVNHYFRRLCRKAISVRFCLPAVFLAVLALAAPAFASPPVAYTPPAGDMSAPASPESAHGGFFEGIDHRSNLLGDMGGLREALAKRGITLSISETSELLGNATGGYQKGFEYDGLTIVDIQQDTQRAYRYYGGLFNVSALQLHGNNLSQSNLGSLQTASGIEADRSTRLWELWYQQKFLQDDRMDIKVGQQSLDQEFMVSQNAGIFVNTMFGWAMVPSADLPGGGPAYPLSALGVRLRSRVNDTTTLLTGIFNGSPVFNNSGDPQQQNKSGLSFPLQGGALAIAEMQFSYPGLGSLVRGNSAPLAHVYKLGAYYDTEKFADQRYDNTGLSLADPSSTGIPRTHGGDYCLYGTADQMLWVSPVDATRNLNFFTRVMGAPQEDRNLVDLSANIGLVLHDPWEHIDRDDDSVGLALGYAKVGGGASALDKDTGIYSGSYNPVRSSETFIEATYQYAYTPWCTLQPDIQYVINPGGGIPNPNAPGQTVHNELVLGTRVNILF